MSSLPTVASLVASLGHHLAVVEGFRAPETEITAVHISELVDPNAYLAGGELLLTTGLALPQNEIGCRRYVARLVDARVSALALGLGPVHQRPPEQLVHACRDAELALLTVPAPTPFLTISRTYWAARSKSTEQQLSDAVAAHRALVDAAVAPDPAAAILRRLSRVLEGWAALLTDVGDLDQVYPLAMSDQIAALQAEVARLEVAGVHSSASFNIADHVVVVYPLAVENRIVGYLAAGSPVQLTAPQRRVVLTAAALLSLDAVRGQRSESAREATRRCIAILVDAGELSAAQRLAVATKSPVPGRNVAILVARGRDSAGLIRTVEAWSREVLPVAVDRNTAWFLLPNDHDAPASLRERLLSADPTAVGVFSEPIHAEHVGAVRARHFRALSSLSPGDFQLPSPGDDARVAELVDNFIREASTDVRASLVAYLRHRGQWEQASRELNSHRNTVRYRVARARELLGLDLDDPDIAARAWLALRSRGSA